MDFFVVVAKSKNGSLYPVLKADSGYSEFAVCYDFVVISRLLRISYDDLKALVSESQQGDILKRFNS